MWHELFLILNMFIAHKIYYVHVYVIGLYLMEHLSASCFSFFCCEVNVLKANPWVLPSGERQKCVLINIRAAGDQWRWCVLKTSASGTGQRDESLTESFTDTSDRSTAALHHLCEPHLPQEHRRHWILYSILVLWLYIFQFVSLLMKTI